MANKIKMFLIAPLFVTMISSDCLARDGKADTKSDEISELQKKALLDATEELLKRTNDPSILRLLKSMRANLALDLGLLYAQFIESINRKLGGKLNDNAELYSDKFTLSGDEINDIKRRMDQHDQNKKTRSRK